MLHHTGGDYLRLVALGVNHFVWVNCANYKTVDLMPLFAEFAKKYAKDGYSLWGQDHDPNNLFRNLNKVCFDLFLKYRAIPSAGDRHISEFMPPPYLKNPKTAEEWGFALTPVSTRKQWLVDKLAKRKRIIDGEDEFKLKKSGEEGTKLMKALLGMSDMITSVNMPNKGQMEDVPHGVVVETNALVSRDAVYPVVSGKLPDAAHMLVEKHARQQSLLMDACIKKDSCLAFNVFFEDNLVQIDMPGAALLFNEMFENTASYLKEWDINLFRERYI